MKQGSDTSPLGLALVIFPSMLSTLPKSSSLPIYALVEPFDRTGSSPSTTRNSSNIPKYQFAGANSVLMGGERHWERRVSFQKTQHNALTRARTQTPQSTVHQASDGTFRVTQDQPRIIIVSKQDKTLSKNLL